LIGVDRTGDTHVSDKLRIHTALRIFASVAALAGSFGVGACFDGFDAVGLPCVNDNQCGPKDSCIEGLCGGMFACVDGELIGEDKLCDGDPDCPDGSDEDFVLCFGDVESFECDDGALVPAELFCDATADCPDGSDESPVVCAGVEVNSCEAPGGDLGYALGPAHEGTPDLRELAVANLIGSEADDIIMAGGLGDRVEIVSFDDAGLGQQFIIDGFGTSTVVDFELGHVNSDPKIDLVIATTGTDAAIHVYTNNVPMGAPQAFGEPASLPGLGLGDVDVMGIELGQLDGGERSDIVVIVDGVIKGRVFVAFGDEAAAGSGGAYFEFEPLESFSLNYETFLDSAMTDLDGDGDDDLLVSSITDGKGVLWVVERTGEGPADWDAAPIMMLAPAREIALGRFSPMAMSDDIAILDTASGEIRTLRNQMGTLMPQPPLPAVTGAQISGLTLADMNCDGNADYLVNVGSPAEVRVYLGDGIGGYLSPDPVIHASDGTPRGGLAVVLADEDNTPDIVSAVEAAGGGKPEVRLLVTADAAN
jgi:hypothetical protein